jgi:chromate transporter
VRRRDLFVGFLKLGAMGFGGVGPLIRIIVVEERRWLDDPEFAALYGLCQALPGANTCNFAVILGERFFGLSGAVSALFGLLLAPLTILIAVASFFTAFSHNSDVRAALYGSTAAAAGLAIGTAVKMAQKTPTDALMLAVAAAVFVASALLRLPLPAVLAAALPAAYLLRWRQA